MPSTQIVGTVGTTGKTDVVGRRDDAEPQRAPRRSA